MSNVGGVEQVEEARKHLLARRDEILKRGGIAKCAAEGGLSVTEKDIRMQDILLDAEIKKCKEREAHQAELDKYGVSPCGLRVAVVEIKQPEQLIELPESAKRKVIGDRAKVVAVGNGVYQQGNHVPVSVCKVGDVVAFANTANGYGVTGKNGEQVVIFSEHDVVCIYEE